MQLPKKTIFKSENGIFTPATDDENALIFDSVFRSKLRINNPGACAREYNSIMQIIMEALIGWDFKEGKQGFFGIFGEVLGWSDTTEEQGRKTLHSHILLFIALFDRLITMLWSTSEEVRRKAKDELTKYIAQTMSSSYEIVDEYYTHEKKGKEHEELNSLCRIIPKVVPDQTLRNMRHERICHMLKGVIAKCDGCNKSFTSKELIWNAVMNWVRKLNQRQVPIFPNLKKGYQLSKYQMESLALRFSYDMEFYNRHPCDEME